MILGLTVWSESYALLLLRPHLLSQGAWSLIAMRGHLCSVPYVPAGLPWGTRGRSGDTVGVAVESLWAEVRDAG